MTMMSTLCTIPECISNIHEISRVTTDIINIWRQFTSVLPDKRILGGIIASGLLLYFSRKKNNQLIEVEATGKKDKHPSEKVTAIGVSIPPGSNFEEKIGQRPLHTTVVGTTEGAGPTKEITAIGIMFNN